MSTHEGSTTALAERVADRAGQVAAVGRTLQDEVRDLTPQLAAALPPGVMTPERFVRTVLTVLRKNPDLLKCNRESFLGAMMTSAQLGLEIDPALGQAYLVPYKGECTLQIGYKGYIELAARGGILMESREVRENDDFDFDLGSDPYLHHKWKLGQQRGEIIGYYGKATFPDGRPKFHIMDLDDIEKRKKRSQVRSDKGPWKTDPEAMSRKTVIRAMVPQIPLTTELSKALEVDDGIVRMQGHGRELAVSFPDPMDEEVDQASLSAPVKTEERAQAEAHLEGLIAEAVDQQAAIAWLMREHGPIPTLSDDALEDAIEGLGEWLNTPATESAPEGAVIAAEATAASPAPVAPQSDPSGSEGTSARVAVPDDIAAEVVATVNEMDKKRVVETLALFDAPTNGTIGGLKMRLIDVLGQERAKGNPAAEAIL